MYRGSTPRTFLINPQSCWTAEPRQPSNFLVGCHQPLTSTFWAGNLPKEIEFTHDLVQPSTPPSQGMHLACRVMMALLRVQPKVFPLQSVLVPRPSLDGREALPALGVDCRTFFFRKELTKWKTHCWLASGCSQRPVRFAKSS